MYVFNPCILARHLFALSWNPEGSHCRNRSTTLHRRKVAEIFWKEHESWSHAKLPQEKKWNQHKRQKGLYDPILNRKFRHLYNSLCRRYAGYVEKPSSYCVTRRSSASNFAFEYGLHEGESCSFIQPKTPDLHLDAPNQIAQHFHCRSV